VLISLKAKIKTGILLCPALIFMGMTVKNNLLCVIPCILVRNGLRQDCRFRQGNLMVSTLV
jgi:hypothetical protein